METAYTIKKTSHPIIIDADWNKPAWKTVDSIEVGISHWQVQSEHVPKTQVKLQYDAGNLYVIFRVQDCYVRAAAKQIHDPVWKDSCVEFFFSPHSGNETSYFNLEVNCCGIPLMQHHTDSRENTRELETKDCQKIQIASSASGPIQNEIAKPITWTLEYAFPFELLGKYSNYEKPATGVSWRANFYKCADDSSHPHWMAWSPIERQHPDFHRPEFFGRLNFSE